MTPKSVINEQWLCLFAPDGTPQPVYLAPDVPTCFALLKMMADKGIGLPAGDLMAQGFKILPVRLSIIPKAE